MEREIVRSRSTEIERDRVIESVRQLLWPINAFFQCKVAGTKSFLVDLFTCSCKFFVVGLFPYAYMHESTGFFLPFFREYDIK